MQNLTASIKIIELPISCDTLLVTFSPHHTVTHYHAHQPQQLLNIFQSHQNTHRLCLLANTSSEAQKAIRTLREQQHTIQEPIASPQKIDTFEINASLGLPAKRDESLIEQMISTVQEKANLIHLKCLLSQTQNQLERLKNQIETKKKSKRSSKQEKIASKLLQALQEKKISIGQQISLKNGINNHQEEEEQDEDLELLEELQGNRGEESQSKKENLI